MFQPLMKNIVNRPPPQRVQNEPPHGYYHPRFRPPVNEMRQFPQRGNFTYPPMMGPPGPPPHLRHSGNVIYCLTFYYTLINLGSTDECRTTKIYEGRSVSMFPWHLIAKQVGLAVLSQRHYVRSVHIWQYHRESRFTILNALK